MITKGRFINWQFNGAEVVAGIFTVVVASVGVTLWSVSTFQSKSDAAEMKIQLQREISDVRAEVASIRSNIEAVAKDTAYIRGRLEPKN